MTTDQPGIPEFDDVHEDADGFHARHRASGRRIQADTYRGLELRAAAVRVLEAWRRAEETPFRTGDLR